MYIVHVLRVFVGYIFLRFIVTICLCPSMSFFTFVSYPNFILEKVSFVKNKIMWDRIEIKLTTLTKLYPDFIRVKPE